VDTIEEMEWFSQVETMRVELLAQHGLKSCIGQFMVTTPGKEMKEEERSKIIRMKEKK
jgi:hypothetical protein